MDGLDQPSSKPRRKRKASAHEVEHNERLSKRLSLLNLGTDTCSHLSLHGYIATNAPAEQNGSKLYVPVETPSVTSSQPNTALNSTASSSQQLAAAAASNPADDDSMRIDDTKHKVYIYNIDDELSSDSEADEGKLVFLPDIEKHLRQTRIPPHVLASDDGQLAGMQLVVYSDPKSLTVPEDEDGVRKAVIEARHRLRNKQRREGQRDAVGATTGAAMGATIARNLVHEEAGRSEVAAIDEDDAMDMD